MSTVTTSHVSSTSKINTWFTPSFNNNCMKKIMEYFGYYEYFKIARLNRHCNLITSTKYPNLSFCLGSLFSVFKKVGSFNVGVICDMDELINGLDNAQNEVVYRNGSLKFLKLDVWETIGEDQDILIKKGEGSLKVENRNTGECLAKLTPPNRDIKKIISAFRISTGDYVTVTSTGLIDKYNAEVFKRDLQNHEFQTLLHNFSGISFSKVIQIEDKIYLLGKRTIDPNLILMCYDIKKKASSFFCKPTTYLNLPNPILDCIANKTHIFVVYQFGVFCYDNQNKLIWKENDRLTNQQCSLKLNDKFLMITSFTGSITGWCYKLYDIANGTFKYLKSKKPEDTSIHKTLDFWEGYIISQSRLQSLYVNGLSLELWNPNNGKLVVSFQKETPADMSLYPLKNKNGLISQSCFNNEKDYDFFLLKLPGIPKKK